MIFSLSAAIESKAQKNNGTAKTGTENGLVTFAKLDEYKLFLENVTKKNSENLDRKIKKEYNEIISEKNNSLITELNEHNFLFDSAITKYLGSIFDYIIERNNLDKNKFHFLVHRSAEANAYTYEDGTIICNLGILNIVETESQVAMIFCHELAHYLLNHANNAIIKSIERFNSDEFLSEVKEIKKEKYNTKKKLEELLVTDLFNRRRHKRSQELSADSLGMLLLSKTGYSNSSIPRLFDLLDSCESIVTKSTIRAFCNRENININDNWFITQKKMSFGVAEKKEIKDTLKTHPDCAIRKIYAQDFFNKNPKTGTDFILATDMQTNVIKKQSIYEQANYSKEKERLSYYLYQLIQNDALFLSDKYIKTEICKLWVTFCYKLKNHTLSFVTDKPYTTENEKDEYARLLKLLDNADLKTMKEITLGYYNKNKEFILLNEELNTSILNLKQL